MQPKPKIMICGHGSRNKAAVDEFNAFAKLLRQRLSDYDVESGFLQYCTPTIDDGLEALKQRGATHIICLPCMLFAAGHMKNDIPSKISTFIDKNPSISVSLARELGVEAKLLRVAGEHIVAAEKTSTTNIARSASLLMVVGRGSGDADANSNVNKITRMLWEGLGFGWAETAFSGVVEPDITTALEKSAKLEYDRIIVVPYFLFSGVQVNQVRTLIENNMPRYPGKEILMTSHLGGHKLVIDSFAERLKEVISAPEMMNCLDCDAR